MDVGAMEGGTIEGSTTGIEGGIKVRERAGERGKDG